MNKYPNPAAQAQGEPVAWVDVARDNVTMSSGLAAAWRHDDRHVQPLYPHPDPRVAVLEGLLREAYQSVQWEPTTLPARIRAAIDAARSQPCE